MHIQNRSQFYGSLVWIFSAVVVFVYISFAAVGYEMPGIEQLVQFLASVEGKYVYLTAFVSMFLEGLYFFGSIFPGSTLVVLAAILSQVGGPAHFFITIVSIFLGWCVAGIVNIFLAKLFRVSVSRDSQQEVYEVRDRPWTTWFPSFRANYEVAQVSEGGSPMKVLVSSVRVKLFASIAAALVTLLVPFFVKIDEMSNEEGFLTLGIIAGVTLVVGAFKMRLSTKETATLS